MKYSKKFKTQAKNFKLYLNNFVCFNILCKNCPFNLGEDGCGIVIFCKRLMRVEQSRKMIVFKELKRCK